ncbi:hypothetical protein [Streptomyces pluripotens]|uniref:hypothetical protein n=1 Tax=Streptomyces pluripotens TaxID=1355015 RepID=UPI000693DBDC|nr:hypothetical protein [Streptomyces pluripotens]
MITANPEQQERELIKLAAPAGTLRRRGVAEPAASLAAEVGVAVFKVGFERWITGPGEREMPQLTREALDELRAVATGGRLALGAVPGTGGRSG